MSDVTELESLSKLFKDKMFRIPDYQRGYSWEEEQILAFIDDLKILDINQNNQNNSHYTGMLSLKEFENEEKDKIEENWILDSDESITPYYVIDGQQRLTTCVILIQVIINYLRNIEDMSDKTIRLKKKTLKELSDKYIFKEDPETSLDSGPKAYKLLYLNDEISNNYLKNAIFDKKENSSLTKTLYTNNMLNAKRIFEKWIDVEATRDSKNKEDINLEAIENIFDKVTNRLKFNIYYIDKTANVNVAFETMNNRGKNLTNLELLKNRLIYLSTKMNASEKDMKVLRDNINDAWKTVYNTLGKNENIKMDDDEYLRHHWIIYFPYSRSQINGKQIKYDRYLLNEYFSQIRLLDQIQKNTKLKIKNDIKEINDENFSEEDNDDDSLENEKDISLVSLLKENLELNDIQKYVFSIKFLVKFWYQTKVPEKENLNIDIKNLLIKINRLRIAQVRPLTTVIMSKYIKDDNDNLIIKVLEKLERFLFINFALRKVASNYKDSTFYIWSRKLNEGNMTLEKLCDELENIEDINNNKIINISEIKPIFKKYFNKNEGFYSKSWKLYLKYFLYEYENSLIEDISDSTIDKPDEWFKEKSELSIEHIYPETPKEIYGWIKDFEEYTTEEQHCFMHTLGNLLPLSNSDNSSLKNFSYDTKKEKSYKWGCQSEIQVANTYEKWNPQSIVERSLLLLEFMEKRWNFKFKSEDDKYDFLNIEFYREHEKGK